MATLVSGYDCNYAEDMIQQQQHNADSVVLVIMKVSHWPSTYVTYDTR